MEIGVDRAGRAPLIASESRISVRSGSVLRLHDVSVFNIGGGFCDADQMHAQAGSEGIPDLSSVTCPRHGSRFDVCTGAVLRGFARDPGKAYFVTSHGDAGCVAAPRVPDVQSE